MDSAFYNIQLGNGKTTFATTFKMEILSNSIDDTILIGNRKIPPTFTGSIISRHDYYESSYRFTFKSLKAKKGIVEISYQY